MKREIVNRLLQKNSTEKKIFLVYSFTDQFINNIKKLIIILLVTWKDLFFSANEWNKVWRSLVSILIWIQKCCIVGGVEIRKKREFFFLTKNQYIFGRSISYTFIHFINYNIYYS